MRRTIPAALLVLLVLSTGCIGFITGSEPQSFEAKPAAVGGDAASSAGYQETSGPTAQTVNRTFSAGGESRTVQVTNYLTEYRKTVDAGPLGSADAAVFAVVSTPKVEVLGQTFNPVGDVNESELARMAQSKYDGFSVGEKQGSTTVDALGSETEVAKFAGRATVAGEASVDVYVHVARIETGDDYLVVVAVYPQLLSGEDENVFSMVRNLEHPA